MHRRVRDFRLCNRSSISRTLDRHTKVGARDLAISVTSLLFSLWVTFASGYQAVYQAMLLLLIGIPIYAFLKARRERLGLMPEPVDQIDQAEEPVAVTSS